MDENSVQQVLYDTRALNSFSMEQENRTETIEKTQLLNDRSSVFTSKENRGITPSFKIHSWN